MVDMTTRVAQAAPRHGRARQDNAPLQQFQNSALQSIGQAIKAAPTQGAGMPFELQVPGVDRKHLTEIAGEQGPFYIARIGGKPELENGFFYGDDRNQFFFYARMHVLEGEKFDIEVFGASVSRFSGPVPNTVGSHLPTIRSNIHKLFEERDFYNPSVPWSDANRKNLRSVRFTWSVM